MKILVKPLVAGVFVIAAAGVNAETFSGNKVKDMINSMDDSGDQGVSFQEYFEESVTDNDDSYDVNKDGYITTGEVVLEIKEDLVQTIHELRKQGVSEENINKTIANELETAEAEADRIVKAIDTDGDFLIEPEELKAYKRKKFRSLDRNRDGVISTKDIKRVKRKGWPIHQY